MILNIAEFGDFATVSYILIQPLSTLLTLITHVVVWGMP
jgi:hypothetical protein